MYRNGYQHMVLDEYVRQVREILAERRARLAALSSPGQARDYQQHVREVIRRVFAPQAGPPPKTPLNPKVTRVIERDAFRVENVMFESRPGFPVTANLYVPNDLTGPAPCVLGSCGHSEAGKACDLYQQFSQRLAYAGFVVLTFDPICQGERDQYLGSGYRDEVGWGTSAHNMAGKQLELLGDWFGFWRAWDGIRALDYLLSRPEVDPTRVGLTGNSGGGTMSTWLWALDDRFTMVAPSCFVISFLSNLENEEAADAEQCPPDVLGAGIDHADFIIAGAPKPVLLLGQQYDFFDRRGLKGAFADVQAFYGKLGAADRVEMFIGPHGHGYYVENQQAMVAFFCKHAGMPVVQKQEIDLLPVEDLWATPTGQTNEVGGVPIYQLIADQARETAQDRLQLDAAALKARLAELLTLPPSRSLPHYRIPRPVYKEGEVHARYAVETEGGIRAILRQVCAEPTHPSDAHPSGAIHPTSLDVDPQVRLYLPHVSAEADLAENKWVIALKEKRPLFALDVRGLGESMPEEHRDDFFNVYSMDYMFHAHGAMLGRSYMGRRVYDLLCVIDLLAHEGVDQVHLYGRGQGAILALLGALFHERVASVTLKDAPQSVFEWTQTPYTTWPAANFVRGMLRVCDLPDVIAALGDKVTVIDHWGPEMETIQS